jgi:hypothetical protein
MAKQISGGGATSNKRREVSVKAGSPNTRKINPGAVSNIGISQVFTGSSPKVVAGEVKDFVPLGNAVALNVGKGGPGTGREVLRCGTQGCHDSAPRSAASARPKHSTEGGAPKMRGTT